MLLNRGRRPLCVCVFALACSTAPGGVIVEYRSSAGAPWTLQTSNPSVSPGAIYDVAMDRCQPGSWRIRTSDPTSESISLISFTNTTGPITLILGGPSDNDPSPQSPLVAPACLDWTIGLNPGSAAITLQARVQRDIGPLAEIRADAIVRLDAGGDIISSAIRHQSATQTLHAVTAGGSITDNLDDPTSPAIIRSEGGCVALVRASGQVMCPVAVQPVAASAGAPLAGCIGRIESITADVGGARPTNSSATDYHATPISARVIDAVVGKNVRADITATEGVRRVEATSGGLRGSVACPRLLPIDASAGGIVRAAGVNAMNIALTDGLPKGASISAGQFYGYINIPDAGQPRITLGGAHRLGGQIALNIGGGPKPMVFGTTTLPRVLMGRIVINGAVSPITIADDVYAGSSTSLGGGALGVAAYQLFEADCTPPHNQLGRYDGPLESAFTDPAAVPVIIRSYGPVALPASVGDPNSAFTIQRLENESACLWSSAATMFNVSMHPARPGYDEQRAIGLSRGAIRPTPGVYRVIPTSLICAGVASSPVVQWADSCSPSGNSTRSYTFRVAPDCDSDGVNDNRQLDDLYTPVPQPLLEVPREGTTPAPQPPDPEPQPDPNPVPDPQPKPDPQPTPNPDPTPDPNPEPGPPPAPSPEPTPDPDPIPDPPTPPHTLPPAPVLTCITVCLLDVNKDHTIGVQDIFEFLTFWFSGNLKADWNGSHAIEVQDIFQYLEAWFNASRTSC